MKWKSESPQAPFLKIILKWSSYEEKPKKDEQGNIVHDGEGHIIYERKKVTPAGEVDKEFYYKIPINPSTVSTDGYYSLNPNEWYDFSFDVAILGSTAEELPVILSGRYYVVDWNDPGISGGGSLDQSSYLNLASKSDVFYMYGVDELDIPVISSHALVQGNNDTRVLSAQYYDPKRNNGQGAWVSVNNRGIIKQVKGRSSVTFRNELTTEMGSDLDCYRFQFEVLIKNEAGDEQQVTIIQYPSIYIDSKQGGNAMVDGYFGNVYFPDYPGTQKNRFLAYKGRQNGPHEVSTGYSGTSDSSNEADITYTPYAPIQKYANRQKFMTVVSISSLANNPTYTLAGNTYQYIIADPRSNNSFAQNGGLIAHYKVGPVNDLDNGQEISWTDDEVSAIKIGNSDRNSVNYIAPKFLVSSRWGKMGNWLDHNTQQDFRTAQKRCATYQEAGYPAGRWRLPTEAELCFMISLQSYGFIDELYSVNKGPSISASGSMIMYTGNQGNPYTYYSTISGTPSCRCVYDLWYWGEDPVADVDGTYTIKVDY